MRPRTHHRPSSLSLWLVTLIPLVLLAYGVFRAGGVVDASTEFSDAPLIGPGTVLRTEARGDVSDLHCVDISGASFAFRVEPFLESSPDRKASTDSSADLADLADLADSRRASDSNRTRAPRSCAAFSILGPGGQNLYEERSERCGSTGRYTLDTDRVTIIAAPQRGYELRVTASENPGRYCLSVLALPTHGSKEEPLWPYRLTIDPN